MIHVYGFKYSTNLERVEMALAHKGIKPATTEIDPGDRSLIRRLSGQDLVPILDLDGEIIVDSVDIIRRLDKKFPD